MMAGENGRSLTLARKISGCLEKPCLEAGVAAG